MKTTNQYKKNNSQEKVNQKGERIQVHVLSRSMKKNEKKRGHAYPIHTIEHSNHPLPIFSLSPQKRHPMVYHYSPKTKKKKTQVIAERSKQKKAIKRHS